MHHFLDTKTQKRKPFSPIFPLFTALFQPLSSQQDAFPVIPLSFGSPMAESSSLASLSYSKFHPQWLVEIKCQLFTASRGWSFQPRIWAQDNLHKGDKSPTTYFSACRISSFIYKILNCFKPNSSRTSKPSKPSGAARPSKPARNPKPSTKLHHHHNHKTMAAKSDTSPKLNAAELPP